MILNLVNEKTTGKLAKDFDTTDEIIRSFVDQNNNNICEYQINESLRVRERIYEKTIFEHRISNEDFSNEHVDGELQKNLYFLTVRFNPKFHSIKFEMHRQLAQANAVASIYEAMANGFISHPFARNARLLPFLQLYLDGDGSRYSNASRNIDVPHYHGLLLTHFKTTARFDEWLFEHGDKVEIEGKPSIKLAVRGSGPIETVTFSKFNPDFGSLPNLISYVTKYARNDRFTQGTGDFLELSSIHPQLPKRMYPYYCYSKKPIFTEAEFISFEKDN